MMVSLNSMIELGGDLVYHKCHVLFQSCLYFCGDCVPSKFMNVNDYGMKCTVKTNFTSKLAKSTVSIICFFNS